MAMRMLIDARHSEETRVAVLKGNRIEEFDFESAEHKQIKGNIYLAKVTRVEPSLQAAFVDFGGNRHGFLAFSEIHPDYYQIPQADREQLLAEEAEAAEEEARLRAEDEEDGISPGDEYDAEDDSAESLAEDLAEDGLEEIDTSEKDEVATIEDGASDDDGDYDDGEDERDDHGDQGDHGDDYAGAGDRDADGAAHEDEDDRSNRSRNRRGARRQGKGPQRGDNKGGAKGSGGRSRAKEVDEVRAKRMALRRRYKIQDVIQRRQVLLVQVVKEERGNKGAALTTYLSLAGRYTVLMPNSSHGGGISRKISSSSDRKRLKEIVSDLSLPKSMGLIVRTAGLSRTKPEIKRDFDYLARLWDEIRQTTLASVAPALIHSDSDLIKRAIRDLYNREIEEVVVEGEEGYKAARAFMKMLMPSHARRVKAYSDPVPLFQRYGAEDQLRAMYDPMVQLKSGGYLIINPTEALVSIDINSGRSTKEHGIEATALHTNLEAAKEIARQLRLRDMAGLVVIDFIDMEYSSNTRKVEKAMKDALKSDRARIQVGRISGFGLMEMSRQRLRTGVLEATTRECPHCDGSGLVRTASSAGLSALRLIEDEAAKGKGTLIRLAASTEAAVYLLNEKRHELVEIEDRYGVMVEVRPEGEQEGAKMSVSSHGPRPVEAPRFEPIVDDDDDDYDLAEDDDADEDEAEEQSSRRGGGREARSEERSGDEDGDERGRKKRRRRRGGRGRNKSRFEDGGDEASEDRDEDRGEDGPDDAEMSDATNAAEREHSDEAEDSDEDKRRKRRRRGGRNRRRKAGEDEQFAANDDAADNEGEVDAEAVSAGAVDAEADTLAPEGDSEGGDAAPPPSEAEPEAEAEAAPEPKPKRKRAPRKKPFAASEVAPGDADAPASAEAAEEDTPKAKPVRKRAPRKSQAKAAEMVPETVPEPVEQEAAAPAPAEVAEIAAPEPAVEAVTEPVAEEATEIASAEAQADTQPQADAKPRRGWWQRTFGD